MKFILFFRVFLVLLLVSSSVNSQERPLKQEKKASGMSEIRVPQPESVIPGIDFIETLRERIKDDRFLRLIL